jgi:hypothetical protein
LPRGIDEDDIDEDDVDDDVRDVNGGRGAIRFPH